MYVYFIDVIAVRQSYFHSGSSTFLLDNLDCRGTEDNLFACSKAASSRTCDVDESAGVRCGG